MSFEQCRAKMEEAFKSMVQEDTAPSEPILITEITSPNDLEVIVYHLIHKKVLPEPSMLQPVCNYLDKQVRELIEQEDYDEAEKLTNIKKTLIRKLKPKTAEDTSKIDERIQRTQADYQEIERKWNELIASQEKKNKSLLSDLEAKHDKELQEFEEKWQNPESLKVYSKPSQYLLQLRKLQRQHAVMREFEKAKTLKAQADKLQAVETKEAQKRAEDAMRTEYIQIVNRQKREIECAKDFGNRKIQQMELQKQHDLNSTNNAIKQLMSRKPVQKNKVRVRRNIATPRSRSQGTNKLYL